MVKTIKNKISEWREYILLLLAIFNIIGIGLAAYITIRLAPLEQNLAVVAQDIRANDERDEREHSTFVTKEAFGVIVERINHISSRVDLIYSIVANRKSSD